MLRKEENSRTQTEEFCVEDFVLKDHLPRKIEEAVDFSYIYELVKDLYAVALFTTKKVDTYVNFLIPSAVALLATEKLIHISTF